MVDDVTRRYRSTRRTEQAALTRQAVLAAARDRFVADGWTATSVDAIAADAGVSRATVFAVGGKAELLKLVYDIAVAGDDAPEPVERRTVVAGFERADDPEELVQAFVSFAADVGARAGAVYLAVRAAADADPRVRTLYDDAQRQRLVGAGRFVTLLRGRGFLRDGLDPGAATDVLWTLLDPGLHAALVGDRGWPPERFRAWLAATLGGQLLAVRRGGS